MPIEILSEAMKRIVTSQQDAEELGSGFGGPHGPAEGPVWWKEGGYLLFSDIHASRRMKWQPGQGISIDKEGTANANGQTRDRQGRLVGLPPFQPLRRPPGGRRVGHGHRRSLSRPEAQPPERRGRQVGRQ